MKKLVTLILLLTCFVASAQNMVPNGDFEYYTTCPTSASQIIRATGWAEYSPSSDYFNACATSNVSVPINWIGTQSAASGSAYAGFAVSPTVNGFREAITRPITPLAIGSTYQVSMSVSLAEGSRYGMNCLGVYFFDNAPTTASATAIAGIIPQASFSSYGPISNQTNWVRVTTTFVADSAYDNIAITGFGPVSSFVIDTVNTTNGLYAYYYIDSVVVKLLGGINNLYTDSMICAGDTFQVPYTINMRVISTAAMCSVFS